MMTAQEELASQLMANRGDREQLVFLKVDKGWNDLNELKIEIACPEYKIRSLSASSI